MKKLVLSDIVPARLYEPIREDMRRKVIEAKRWRRVALGDHVSVIFENRTTMIFQVEEMLRAEHIEEPVRMQHEIDVYNELLPDAGELTATLFVEVTESAQIRPVLHRLVGIDEHVMLHVGEHAVRAEFEPGRAESDRISSVQYLRFRLGDDAQAALRTPGTRLLLASDHPHYRHSAELAEETRRSLAADLEPPTTH